MTLKRGKLAGMKLVRGGAFRMGSDDFYEDERPARTARVGDFWIENWPDLASDSFEDRERRGFDPEDQVHARFVLMWGSNLLSTAPEFYTSQPWLMVWPGLAVLATTLSFNLLGDGLRDAFDPRSSL